MLLLKKYFNPAKEIYYYGFGMLFGFIDKNTAIFIFIAGVFSTGFVVIPISGIN
ncbi:MAG: hypothetical protein ACI8P3_001491 [Saprospiraceae bacterium]|jgi:hypothetical protein